MDRLWASGSLIYIRAPKHSNAGSFFLCLQFFFLVPVIVFCLLVAILSYYSLCLFVVTLFPPWWISLWSLCLPDQSNLCAWDPAGPVSNQGGFIKNGGLSMAYSWAAAHRLLPVKWCKVFTKTYYSVTLLTLVEEVGHRWAVHLHRKHWNRTGTSHQ